MSLKLLQAGVQPLGQFDGKDGDFLTLLGGEVVTFTSVVATSATDKAAFDSFDGYVNPNKRPVVTKNLTDGYARPLMLADDGTTGYGTLFGTVVGGTVGQVVSGGVVFGPHTATGSGKVTCWDKPGMYAVSLDGASHTDLRPTNVSCVAGAPLYVTSTGLLTPTVGAAVGGDTRTKCGRFVEFSTNGALVTTSNNMLGAVRSFAFAVFYFNPGC